MFYPVVHEQQSTNFLAPCECVCVRPIGNDYVYVKNKPHACTRAYDVVFLEPKPGNEKNIEHTRSQRSRVYARHLYETQEATASLGFARGIPRCVWRACVRRGRRALRCVRACAMRGELAGTE